MNDVFGFKMVACALLFNVLALMIINGLTWTSFSFALNGDWSGLTREATGWKERKKTFNF